MHNSIEQKRVCLYLHVKHIAAINGKSQNNNHRAAPGTVFVAIGYYKILL